MCCPVCKRPYKFYETRCNRCEVDLVANRPAGAPVPDSGLVSVFDAQDPGILALATMALEAEGIDFSTRTGGLPAVFGWSAQFKSAGSVNVVTQIVVAADVADRSRAVLADLAASADPMGGLDPAPPFEPAPSESCVAPGIELRDAETGAPFGAITAEQLRFLGDHLEEESAADDDSYIDAATIDMLIAAHADAGLIEVLRRGLGAREGMDVRWPRP